MKKLIYLLTLLCGMMTDMNAQNNKLGDVSGLIYGNNKTKIKGAKVSLWKEEILVKYIYSDSTGFYRFGFLESGNYILKVSKQEYTEYEISINVLTEDPLRQDIRLQPRVEMRGHLVKGKQEKPFTPPCLTCIGIQINPLQIPLPPSVSGMIDLAPGFNKIRGGLSSGGNRVDGNLTLRNGMRVNGDGIIYSSLEVAELNSGGISVRFGDMSGGQLSYSTRMPGLARKGTLLYFTSSGLDGRNYNQAEMVYTGPLRTKQDRMILGYTFAANYIYTKDASPIRGGYALARKAYRDSLNQLPIRFTSTGQEYRAHAIGSEEITQTKWNPGSGKNIANVFLTLVWQPNVRTSIYAEGGYQQTQNRQISPQQAFFNPDISLLNKYEQITGSLRYQQILLTDEQVGRFKSAYINIRWDYNSQKSETSDELFGTNFFKYGHIGAFTTRKTAGYKHVEISPISGKPKEIHGKTADGLRDTTLYLYSFFEQQPDSATGVTFNPVKYNSTRGAYTSQILDFYGSGIKNINDITSRGGLMNGDQPPSIYNLYAAPGTGISGYAKSQTDLVNVGAEGGVKIMNKVKRGGFHDIIFGMQFEQRTYRSYSLNAASLWTLMRQLSNAAAPVLDYNHPVIVYDRSGVFSDTIQYNRLVIPGSESTFIYNLRKRLITAGATDEGGNIIHQNSYIATDRIDPSFLKLSDFSADELLNGGKSSLVNYYGYDYLGHKQKGNNSPDDFINNSQRSVGAFKPIYTAWYIQDRFTLKDFTIQIGFRAERYDANQPVLQDPYSLYPAKSAGDVKKEGNNLSSQIHSQIPDHAIVYVNDIQHPTAITGYRVMRSNNRAEWYDKNGNALSNPEELAHLTTSGRIAPYLVNPFQKTISAGSFKDYIPAWNLLPRLWFRFPISSEAFFFAHYDAYAQRPPEGVIATIDDYYFLPQRNTEIINNPALQPVRRTDYEIGFKHRIGRMGLLSLMTTYSEVRNLIQVTRFNQAYPVSYTSFGNLDFSTVKSFRAEYQHIGSHFSLLSNYVLQFADGTGSNGLSAAALIASGQPNLRNVYPLDFDIRHVIKSNIDIHFNEQEGRVGRKYIFQRTGLNLTLQARSGLPFSRITFPINTVQEGIVSRSMISGSINGSRMPWNYQADLNIYKNIPSHAILDSSGKILKYKYTWSAFLWIQNVFNAVNVQNVFQYTGSPTDDGYLASAWGQQALRNEKYAGSLAALYNSRLINSGFSGAPRLFQLGMRLTW